MREYEREMRDDPDDIPHPSPRHAARVIRSEPSDTGRRETLNTASAMSGWMSPNQAGNPAGGSLPELSRGVAHDRRNQSLTFLPLVITPSFIRRSTSLR
jgi:hypothetical protein